MKNISSLFLAVLLTILAFLGSCSPSEKANHFKAITYNIRYDNPGDGENRWDKRKAFLAEQVVFHQPDFLGIQEGLHHQVAFLDSSLQDYDYIGVGRDDGKEAGEYTALYFRKSEWELTDHGNFWLSETPSQISKGWDAAIKRICTWGAFTELNSGKELYVFNTHYDHIGDTARSESSKLILKKINDIVPEGKAAILMGDFNAETQDKPIQILLKQLKDSELEKPKPEEGPKGTWTGFDISLPLDRRIDYIFFNDELTVKQSMILDTKIENQRYPSDHLPVLSEFTW